MGDYRSRAGIAIFLTAVLLVSTAGASGAPVTAPGNAPAQANGTHAQDLHVATGVHAVGNATTQDRTREPTGANASERRRSLDRQRATNWTTSGTGSYQVGGVEVAGDVATASGPTEVIVQFDGAERGTLRRSDDVLESLRDRSAASSRTLAEYARTTDGVTVEEHFWITDAALVTVDTDRSSIRSLAGVDGVERIHPNYEAEYLGGQATSVDAGSLAVTGSTSYTYGLEMIGVPEFWDRYGVRGENATVAVIDSGVDAGHPNVTLAPDGWAEFDARGDREYTSPADPIGHGTHVAGTVTGGTMNGTRHFGVAPNASLLVAGHDSEGTVAAVYASMEWALAHDRDVDVMTASLGFEPGVSTLQEPIRNARLAGVVVTAAAGNTGDGRAETPGDGYDAVSVGAVNASGGVASWSSSDRIDTDEYWTDPPDGWPATYDTPSVTAPGVDVCSSVPGGQYACWQGTSMATPHVAGTAALLRSMDPSMSAEAVRLRLTQSAVEPDDVTPIQDRRYGHGIVNVTRAAALEVGTVEGTITTHGSPATNATVYTDQNAFDATSLNGGYSVPVTGGNRTLRVNAPGYVPVTRTVSASGDGSVTQHFDLTNRQPAVTVMSGQPQRVRPGESLTVTVYTENTSTLRITPAEQFSDPANTSLSVEGNASVGYGDAVTVDGSGEWVDVTVTPSEDYVGAVALNVTAGTGLGAVSKTTGPTGVHGDVIEVPQDLPSSMNFDELIDVVGTNTTIVLDSGTYGVETDDDNPLDAAIVLERNVTLTAADGAAPVIDIDDVAEASETVSLTGQNATLSGVEIRGDHPVFGVVGVSGDDAVVANVTIREGNRGIDALGGTNVQFRDNRILANWTGLLVGSGAHASSIHNNTISNAVDGIEVEGTATYAGFNSIHAPEQDGIHVTGDVAALQHNRVTDPGDDGILIGGEVSLVENNTVTVGGTTAIEIQGTVDDLVRNDVELTSESQQGISIWGGADVGRVSDNDVTAPPSVAVPISVDGVGTPTTIDNNTLRGGDVAIDVASTEPIAVRDNDVRNGRVGIEVQSSGDVTHRLVDNRIHDTSNRAIWLLGGNGSVIAGNDVTDVEHWGIASDGVANVTLRDNEVAWPAGNPQNWAGVFVTGGSDHVVSDNEVDGGHVLVQAVADTTVRNSTIRDSDWGVVVSSYASVNGSVITPATNVTTVGTSVSNVASPVEVTTGSTNVTVAHPDAVASFGTDDPAPVTRLTLADGTTISGSGNDVDVGLADGAFAPPPNRHLLGSALDATATGADPQFTLGLDVSDESTGALYEGTFGFYADANGTWSQVARSTVDDGMVRATNLTAPVTVAAFGEPDGTIEGVVQNATGAPVDGATVTLSRDDRSVATLITNASGDYGGEAPADVLNATATRPAFTTNGTSIVVGVNDTVTADFTIERLAHYFAVDGFAAPNSTTAGSSYTVSAPVANRGIDGGNTTVEYLVDGTVVENATVDLDAGNATAVEFQHTLSDAGEYSHRIRTGDDAAHATIAVEAAETGGGGGGGGFFPPPDSGDSGPSFSIASVDLGSDEVEVGETVSVDVRVENDGDEAGEYTATLTADGQEADSETVTVNANYHATARLSTSFDAPGTYRLAVDGESAGTVEVTGEPDLAVTNTSIGATAVDPGETVAVTATVENTGTVEGSSEVALAVDGEVVATETATVSPGSSTSVTLEHAFAEAGNHEVAVEGQSVATVTVTDPDDGTANGSDGSEGAGNAPDGDGSDGDGGDGLPGFGPVVALVGLLGGALLATRRLN